MLFILNVRYPGKVYVFWWLAQISSMYSLYTYVYIYRYLKKNINKHIYPSRGKLQFSSIVPSSSHDGKRSPRCSTQASVRSSPTPRAWCMGIKKRRAAQPSEQRMNWSPVRAVRGRTAARWCPSSLAKLVYGLWLWWKKYITILWWGYSSTYN